MSSSNPPQLPPVAVLAAVTATAPVAMHLYVPSMPGLVSAFATTPAMVQLTLTLYMMALAVATLGCGPISDRFGRRPVILAALVIYASAGLVCAVAQSIEVLIVGRIVQALGGAAGLTLGRAMVRDCYDADGAAGMIALLSMIMAVIPALSPAIGGLLDVWLGWRAGFIAVSVFGIIVLVCAYSWLGETHRYAGPQHASTGRYSVFAELARSRTFLGFGLHCVCTLSAWYAIIAGAPYIMVVVMKRAPSEYGAWFVLVALGWVAGNLITARLARRVGIMRMVPWGSAVTIAAVLLLAYFVATDSLSPASLFLPLALIGVGHGLSQPSAMSGAIGVNPHAAGRASGLLGFMQMTCGALAAQLLGVFQDHSAWPLVVMVLLFSIVSLASFYLVPRACA